MLSGRGSSMAIYGLSGTRMRGRGCEGGSRARIGCDIDFYTGLGGVMVSWL